jgi:hypothetical protein
MPKAKLLSQGEDKNGAFYLFQDTDPAGLAASVATFFKAEGYKLEEGTPQNGDYGKGSEAMRVLFGGLTKRFKFRVQISAEAGKVRLSFAKAMSGAAGGIMGHSAMGKEFARLQKKIQTFSF